MTESTWTPGRIKALRKRYGEGQVEFAARFRIPVGTYRDWEQGVRKKQIPGPITVILDQLEEKIDKVELNTRPPQLQTA